MQTTVTFKNIDSSDALKSYVQKKLEKHDKMLESPAEANVVLSVEKIRHIAEINLSCDKLKIHAREESESMYSSIDALMDKVRTQINKNKEKILMVFVLIGTGLILIEIAQNIITHLLGN